MQQAPDQLVKPAKPAYRRITGRVKSGCRTCKIRKIKCDEGRPACQRCISTHRECEGYGIWDGGGKPNSRRPSSLIIRPPPSISILAASTEDKQCFEWFKNRTLYKISGAFVSRFWSTLTVQMSFQEPAILEAVLALSSTHRRGVIINTEELPSDRESLSRKQEQSALKHYIKAIKYLQPYLSGKDKSSIRVALIACALFIALDLLRGHFEAALSHLQNGLNIIQQAQACPEKDESRVLRRPRQDAVDEWIIEAFSRLQLQVEFFKQSYQGPCLILQDNQLRGQAEKFQSINEAWQQLHRLFNEILYLADLSRQRLFGAKSSRSFFTVQERQQQIRTNLERWLYMYERLRKSRQGQMPYQESKGYKLLFSYQIIAEIMLNTSLSPCDESLFDLYTIQFAYVVGQMAEIWVTAQEESSTWASPRHQPGQFVDMDRSYIEMGWNPILYYVGLKCRVRRIRWQAIRLLEISSHREGIWDSEIIACILRKVMVLEERKFYQGLDIVDDFPLCSLPSSRDLSLPLIPSSQRMHGLDVVLSGNPMEEILLFSAQANDGSCRRVLVSRFDVLSQRWIDDDD